MNYTKKDKVRLAKKVCIKLSNKKNDLVIEAGFKDWAAGIGMSIVTLFSGIGNASATAKDVYDYIENAENKIKTVVNKHDDTYFKENFKVKNKFKSYGLKNGDGLGQFEIKLGPYLVIGAYLDTVHDRFVFKSRIEEVGNPTSYEEETFREIAEHLEKEINKSFYKMEDKFKKQKKDLTENQKEQKEQKEQKVKPESYSQMKNRIQENWKDFSKNRSDKWNEYKKQQENAWKEYKKL
jgi:ribosome-associated translation inhibitor RaiA